MIPEVGGFEVLRTLQEQGSKIPEQTIQSKSDEGGVGRDFRCLRSGLQMKLTDDQLDALGELFNIGVGKGADNLNQMLDCQIQIREPHLEVI